MSTNESNNAKTARVLNAAPVGDPALAAFLSMQKELPVIPKSRDGYNFKYAPYEQIAKLAFPVMWSHGFFISHKAITGVDGTACVVTTMVHAASGTTWESTVPYEPKAKDQERGKSMTYAKRYSTCLILGLSIEGEPDRDDDIPNKTQSVNNGAF